MQENEEKINELLAKIDALRLKQDEFIFEINKLKVEVHKYKISRDRSVERDVPKSLFNKDEQGLEDTGIQLEKVEYSDGVIEETGHSSRAEEEQELVTGFEYADKLSSDNLQKGSDEQTEKKPSLFSKSSIKVLDFEKFIGENLISKIGILITIVGVGIGAKYSIDNDLISPITRIILGYLVGLGLMGFGIKLKTNYNKFSAVLVSGSIAILYFITFFAFSFYGLISQEIAFALMFLFTIFSVIAAFNYNQQIIAHIGLVGAYAVPFLLGDDSGNITFLFSYIAIIDIGILFIAYKKNWVPLYYSSFFLTWLIYVYWFMDVHYTGSYHRLEAIFLTVFFLLFHISYTAIALFSRTENTSKKMVLVFVNALIFYVVGMVILDSIPSMNNYLGLFTIANAMFYFIFSVIFYRSQNASKRSFYDIASLVLIFITIAVPVQLDGNWVTLIWAMQAALMFWIGRTKGIPFYEKLSYILMVLALISIHHDWWSYIGAYASDEDLTVSLPFLNVNFLVSIIFLSAFGFITYLNLRKEFTPAFHYWKMITTIISVAIPAVFIYLGYRVFLYEITHYFDQLYTASRIRLGEETSSYNKDIWDIDLYRFSTLWALNYSMIFTTLLAYFNLRKIKEKTFGIVTVCLMIFTLSLFILFGLYELGMLRTSYINQTNAEYYYVGFFNVGIRYVSFGLVFFALYIISKYVKNNFIETIDLRTPFEIFLHFVILLFLSNELITWLSIFLAPAEKASYKLGLSILWGVYALVLIVLGIRQHKKYLRLGAIVLFGLTLLKLFFYDLSGLNTISKTIVLVSLGILLLIISFLYNKYKPSDTDEV